MGLSPQARGKQDNGIVLNDICGPIPAGTGETPNNGVTGWWRRAYPRRHGGNRRKVIGSK